MAHLDLVDFGVARHHRAVGQRDVFGQAAAEQLRLEDAHDVGVVADLLDPDPRVRLAVVLAHDELLRDVDESTGEVAGVGGTQRGVGEALAGTVGGDEVLEDREAFTEVRLDRPRE